METLRNVLASLRAWFDSRSSSVQGRITMLLALMAFALIGLLLLVEHGWHRRVNLLLHERVEETQRVSQRILELRASNARLHADDFARRDEFVSFTHLVDANWGEVNLTENLATFGVDVAWVLNDRYDLIFTASPSKFQRLAPLPIPPQTLATALHARPSRHFFAPTQRGLLEVWTSPIQRSDDLERRIHGHYIIGRLWTADRMQDLAHDADAKVDLRFGPGPYPEPSVSPRTGRASINVPLPGIDGTPVASVRFKVVYQPVSRVYQTLRLSLLLGGVLCIVLAFGWGLVQWVSRPLASITEALRQQEPGLLRWSSKLPDELARLAQLVEDFFTQRKKLNEANVADDATVRASDSSPSKPEAGRMTFAFEEVTLEEIVAEAVEEFVLAYDQSELRIEVRAEGPLVPICVDRAKVTQVLKKLLSSAGKVSKRGGTVTVRLETSEGLARVAVEDAGVGIPAGEVELIFDTSVRSSHTQARSGGTGPSLAICREIVEGHEGRIWAENRAGGGAKLTFELPIEGPATAREQRHELESSGALTSLEAGVLAESPRTAVWPP